MKKIILFTIISALIVTVSITSISAQSQYEIPSWVKGIAGYWAEGKITDSEFGEGLSFLIDSQIIKVPLIQELQNQINQLKAENSELRSKLNLPNPTPEPQITVTVSTDQNSYDDGDSISVKRLVRNYSSGDVTLAISNPQGDTVRVDQLTPRSNGLFTTNFPIGPTFDSSGAYKITANHKGIIAITTFEFTTSEAEPQIIISAKANLNIVSNGAAVKISGNIEPYDSSSGKGLTYIIISPEGDTVGMGQITPSSNGYFEKSFVAGGPLWKVNGDYVVNFQYGADSTKVIINYVGGEAVISKPVEPVEPTYEQELANISFTNTRIQNAFGAPITTAVNVSQQIQIATDVTNHSDFPQDFVYYMTIRDTDVERWISGSISGGQSLTPSLSWVPQDSGTYTVDLSLFYNIQNKNKLSDSIRFQIVVS